LCRADGAQAEAIVKEVPRKFALNRHSRRLYLRG
jgi:hypothetical protein